MQNYKTSLFGNIYRILNTVLLCFIANSYFFLDCLNMPWIHIICVCAFILMNLFPSVTKRGYNSFRLRMCCHGNELLIYFVATLTFSVALNIYTAFLLMPEHWFKWILNLVICIIYESVIFWNGIISVYLTSIQLGIKLRIVGLLCGWIPIVNLFVLGKIIKITSKEVNFEIGKAKLNKSRISKRICTTKYPVLLVYGVFFRDSKYFNYWGRVPKELELNGAKIYYGNHQSASSVEDSAEELSAKIEEIVKTTGCEKVNIIAHSKGGLDCRYAISKLKMDKYIASLTTINTPHRGCGFADYLLNRVSPDIKNSVAAQYNNTLKRFGDKNPDFLAAVSCLTQEYCNKFNEEIKDSPSVYYSSVGSKLNRCSNGKFPLNFSYLLVKNFDGDNDGLVSEKSFRWGSDYQFITVKGKRGVSHGDMIDLNRENIDEFDVREFYVQLVSKLREKGL